jgi:hypoxanthine phosphoribosyltransferase
MKNKVQVSSIQIKQACSALADIIKDNVKLDDDLCLVGISRGGIIPMGYLAYYLNHKNTYTIPAETYKSDNTLKESVLIKHKTEHIKFLNENYKRRIFIDDICDTGTTFSALITEGVINREKDYTCSLFYKKQTQNRFISNYFFYYELVADEDWLIFPWD